MGQGPRAQQQYARVVQEYAHLLGSAWGGRGKTDYAAIRESLKRADLVLAEFPAALPAGVLNLFSTSYNNDSFAAAERSYHNIAEFQQKVSNDEGSTPNSGKPATIPIELLSRDIPTIVDWLTAQSEILQRSVDRIVEIEKLLDVSGLTLDDLDSIFASYVRVQSARQELHEFDSRFKDEFGDLYDGENTNRNYLQSALKWADDFRNLTDEPISQTQLEILERNQNLPELSRLYSEWAARRDAIIQAFSPARHDDLHDEFSHAVDAFSILDDLKSDSAGQGEWFAFAKAKSALEMLGLAEQLAFCINRRVDASLVTDIVLRSVLSSWADDVIRFDPRLSAAGTNIALDRDSLVGTYQRLDRDLIAASTVEILSAVNDRRPTNMNRGEPAVIRREGMKKRKHMPVRELISSTFQTTLALKPCFMMSPLAVSQYLPPDIKFDVVIFDEASQVTPGDAINCIYRGNALILAGDTKQLPPTTFFERAVDDDDPESETDVADFQSVLELAKGSGAFEDLGLHWHYRSRHENLITFSNRKFYNSKLITYPSTTTDSDDYGIEFFNAHGIYLRGSGARNPIEAEKVAERVIHHFDSRPGLSLGVVTFSVAQAEAVIAALEVARASRPDLEHHFDNTDRLKGFFVRSLEAVQGDERDVIIFSIGYGPDEAGKITTNFGVLNKPKGWRRLNVGITRARQRIEVIASMTAGEIPPSTNENVQHLRAYLDYAERGVAALPSAPESTGLGTESPFEDSVLDTIRGWGYTAEPQIGEAGYRIDIGIRHRDKPGAFSLGVECDGYMYHSSPVARDRDRLRQQVLEGLGWKLHRIWGTAWYRNRKEEEDRLRAAIEASFVDSPLNRSTPKYEPVRPVVSSTDVTGGSDEPPKWVTPYTVATKKSLPRYVEASSSGAVPYIATQIEHIVSHEQPIHIDVVSDRLRNWWSVGRMGSRLRSNVEEAIRYSTITRDGDFLLERFSSKDVPVRTPANGVERKPHQIHKDEILSAPNLLWNLSVGQLGCLAGRVLARMLNLASVQLLPKR